MLGVLPSLCGVVLCVQSQTCLCSLQLWLAGGSLFFSPDNRPVIGGRGPRHLRRTAVDRSEIQGQAVGAEQ